MTRTDQCSRCGASLPADAPEGSLCPRCLLKLGLEQRTRDLGADEPVEHPETIGRYKILEVLGEGGMGIVYLAEQTEPVRRRVALKLIKLGMDTKQVLARFEAERQALAIMSHPNLAKILDAGATEQGRPYFVMEYCPGIPITEYCDMRCLPLRERLGLFTQVCEAIQHAHQKGIIHRDVKPTNVLVGTEDDTPRLKVIDFGVAKATSQRLTEKTVFTQHGIMIGTPEYMSPEQAGTTGLEVDTRTDIYSLGVLLYELLVGALPFDARTLRQAAAVEMLRIIREEDPPRPRTKFSSLGDTAADVARHRHTDVRSLARQLEGELEWITMRALEKDPVRRYASASEIAADVRRHLDDEPVVAGPAGPAYRLGKVVRKHRGPFAAAAAMLVLLAAGATVSTAMYLRSETARQQAETEATRNDLEVRAYQAALWDDVEGFRRAADQALVLHREALGPDNPELTPYLVNRLIVLAWLGEWGGRPDVAGDLELEALRLIGEWLRSGDPDAIVALALMADYFGPHPELVPLYSYALETMRENFETVDDGTVVYLDYFARMITESDSRYLPDDSLEMAEAAYREHLKRIQKSHPAPWKLIKSRRVALAGVLSLKAADLLRREDYQAAEPVYREAVELLRTVGPEARKTLAKLESDRGLCLTALGRFQEAEAVLLESHEALRQERGDIGDETHQALGRLVGLYQSWNSESQAATYRALLPEIAVERVRHLGPLVFETGALGREKGYSATFGDRSVWLLGETDTRFTTELGGRGQPNTMSWTEDLDATDGLTGFRETTDSRGEPLAFLPWTEEETAFNVARNSADCTEKCDARWWLSPGAVVVDAARDRTLVFYTKTLAQPPGPIDMDHRVGASIAIWSDPDESPVRPDVRPGDDEPTLLFSADEPPWGTAALIVDDWLYAYACECEGLECHCRLARVTLEDALDRSAWRFFAGGGTWSRDWKDATGLRLWGRSTTSVHRNEHLGKYVATYARIWDNRIRFQVADRPEGPWSNVVLEVSGHSEDGIDQALSHPELAKESGRVQYVSYKGRRNEIHLVEITFR